MDKLWSERLPTLIETHAHLDNKRFEGECDEIVGRALAAGVETLITVGTDRSSSEAAVCLAKQYDCVYATVGIHPHAAKEMNDEGLEHLRGLASHSRVVAIGEIGLDYYRDLSPRAEQRPAFEAQLTLAADLDFVRAEGFVWGARYP